MTSRAQDDRGWVLVTALVLTTIMLTIGLAAFNFVGTEQKSSASERERESRLNLAEGVLASADYILGRKWPDTVAKAFPSSCTETSTDARCPQAADVRKNFGALDFNLGMGWNVQIHDNNGTSPNYYSDATILNNPTYDANGDGQLWIRAEGSIAGRKRVVVALLKAETRTVTFPSAPFVSGSVETGNAGNKTIVSTGGYTSFVRCSDGSAPPDRGSNPCRSYDQDKGQIDGPVQSSAPIGASVLTPDQVAALRTQAIAAGTYYATGCPGNPSGAVVFVEQGTCKYTGNMTVNSATAPGVFVVNNGSLQVLGNTTWYGVVYALNAQNAGPSDPVVDLSGNVDFHGGIFIDGTGRLKLGESKFNLTYDPNMFPKLKSFGTVSIVQNTWRELRAN